MVEIRIFNGHCRRGEYDDEYKALIQQVREAAEKIPGDVYVYSADLQVVETGRMHFTIMTHILVYGDEQSQLEKASEALSAISCNKRFFCIEEYKPSV